MTATPLESAPKFGLRNAPAWNRLAGNIFRPDDHVTTAEMLTRANLAGWNVRTEPIKLPENYISDRTFFLSVANLPATPDKTTVFGSVLGRYHSYQNEELFSFGDSILEGGAYWESAGSFKNGRIVFGSMRLPADIVLDPNGRADKVDTYLLVTTSHDGSASIKACVTPVRVWCMNTLTMALKTAKNVYSIRHSAGAKAKAEDARKALGLSFEYMDKFNEEAQALIQTEITDQQWGKILTTLYPVIEDAGRAKTIRDNTVDMARALYLNSPTMENIRGTAWGAVNALTERLDYFRNGRGDNAAENMAAAASGFDPASTAERQRIFDVVKSLTLV